MRYGDSEPESRAVERVLVWSNVTCLLLLRLAGSNGSYFSTVSDEL